jgi:heme a synthase
MAVSAATMAFVLIALGALVRATGSGDACPGWPRCFGKWLPPFPHPAAVSATNVAIEYSHRITALAVFALVAGLAAVAWLRYRRIRRVLVPVLLAAGLWVFQAVLGGLVVRYGLTAWLVTAHLATAMLFAGALVFAAVSSFTVEARPSGRFDRLTRWTALAAGATLALIVVGGYVRGEGAGLAFLDWPLMEGKVVPNLSHEVAALQFAHRGLAALVGLYVGVLAMASWRERRTRRRPVAVLVLAGAGLFAAQVLLGAANVWTRLAAPAVVAHVATAALTWGALVAAASTARALDTVAPEGHGRVEPPRPAARAAGMGSRA